MTNRENLLRAMRRQNPERVPYYFQFCESQRKAFKEKTGCEDYVNYFDLSARLIELPKTKHQNDYSKYHKNLPAKAFIDELGVGQEPGSIAHFTHMHHPMAGFTTPEEVWEFPYPDMLEDYRWDEFKALVEKTHQEGRAAGYDVIHVFEDSWYLRGLENMLMDMMTDEEMAEACLDRMTAFQAKVAARAVEAGVDLVCFGDDVGSQKGMMISPELWRKWLKPRMQKVIQAAKNVNPNVLAFYHSDGSIYEIIPELIEIGVEILNPIQPECMDPVKIKNLYGDKLSFWGTIGTQTTMPFGTPEQVEASIKHMIETVGISGGLTLAPTHLLEPEVPWENIVAFVNAAKKYGRY